MTTKRAILFLGLLALLAGCDDDLLDRDDDGQASDEAGGTDCDDSDPTVFLGAEERCGNSQDDDCDGDVDEDGTGSRTYFADADRDGFGDPSTGQQRCEAGGGFVEDNTDCDDTRDDVNPSRIDDTCDGVDDNCNDLIDDAALVRTWYRDADGDGFGVDVSAKDACESPGADFVLVGGDCDDRTADIHPGATEVCNGKDDDCDDEVDTEVLGSGAACPGASCLDIHTRRPETGNGDFWIDNRLDATDPALVTCVELPRDGRGWMAVDLEWLEGWEHAGFERGGDPGARGSWEDGWDEEDKSEKEVLLDAAYTCHRTSMRWVRFYADLPVEYTEVTGMYGMVSDLAGRASLPWRGVDNVPRPFGGEPTVYNNCGQGAVLFGSDLTIVKTGGTWGVPWGRADRTLCPGTLNGSDPLMCDRWSPTSPHPVSEGSGQLRWELHGAAEGYNSAARISIVDLYVR